MALKKMLRMSKIYLKSALEHSHKMELFPYV